MHLGVTTYNKDYYNILRYISEEQFLLTVHFNARLVLVLLDI